MKTSLYVGICMSLVMMSACKSRSYVSSNDTQTISLDVSEKADTPITDFIESERHIILETNDSCLIGEVNKVQISNDTIFLQAKKEILVFSPQGKYLSSFVNQGQGPEEYLAITSMRIRNGVIYILDRDGRKILSYNKEGNFIQSWKLQDRYIDFYIPDNNHFVLASGYFNPSKYQFTWINTETGETEAQYGEYEIDRTIEFMGYIPFAGEIDNYLIVNTPYNYSNYKMNQVSYEPYLSFDFNTEDKIPQADPKTLNAEEMFDLAQSKTFFMGVQHLSYFTKTETSYYLSFYLTSIRGGSHKNIVKLNNDFRQEGNILLGFKHFDEYPYLREYNYIEANEIVSLRYASTLLENDEDLNLSYWEDQGLTEDSNPVVFVYTLK